MFYKPENLNSVEETLETEIRETLLLQARPRDRLDRQCTFVELGLDSITRIYFVKRVNQYYNIHLNEILVLEYPTIKSLASYIIDKLSDIESTDHVITPSSLQEQETKTPSKTQKLKDVEAISVAAIQPDVLEVDVEADDPDFWQPRDDEE